jgi:hypothetical protein
MNFSMNETGYHNNFTKPIQIDDIEYHPILVMVLIPLCVLIGCVIPLCILENNRCSWSSWCCMCFVCYESCLWDCRSGSNYTEPYCRRVCCRESPYFDEFWEDDNNLCICIFRRNTNQLSDIERNNRSNAQMGNGDTHCEVVVADPFDATEKCSICLENIGEGDALGQLPCKHKHFHKKCVESWMKVSEHKSCPLCRGVISI